MLQPRVRAALFHLPARYACALPSLLNHLRWLSCFISDLTYCFNCAVDVNQSNRLLLEALTAATIGKQVTSSTTGTPNSPSDGVVSAMVGGLNSGGGSVNCTPPVAAAELNRIIQQSGLSSAAAAALAHTISNFSHQGQQPQPQQQQQQQQQQPQPHLVFANEVKPIGVQQLSEECSGAANPTSIQLLGQQPTCGGREECSMDWSKSTPTEASFLSSVSLENCESSVMPMMISVCLLIMIALAAIECEFLNSLTSGGSGTSTSTVIGVDAVDRSSISTLTETSDHTHIFLE